MPSAESAWKLERDGDGVAWLTIDKPGTSTNVLSSSVLAELDALLVPLRQAVPRAVIILSAKKSGFVA
ncbi:MAG: enoyl-CoA hydratase, partial [Alphaproteobacteria bacterium]|nr:enoyl-CoA hydratase [Alphaproteobacteria bacterium]